MSLTNEEIESGNIDLFEHVANPEDKLNFSVTWRLLDFIPLVEQTLLDHLIELLQEKDLFRQQVKASLKQASKLVDNACTQAYISMGFKKADAQEEFEGDMMFGMDMTEKMTPCMLEYMGRIESITNVSGFLTETMSTILETIRESLQPIDERVEDMYLLAGPGAYTMYSFDKYLDHLKEVDKTKTYHTYGLIGDEDAPTSVSSFDVWDVYFKNGKWMSYNEDYGEVPVEKWTLTDDDYVIDIHTEL